MNNMITVEYTRDDLKEKDSPVSKSFVISIKMTHGKHIELYALLNGDDKWFAKIIIVNNRNDEAIEFADYSESKKAPEYDLEKYIRWFVSRYNRNVSKLTGVRVRVDLKKGGDK